jgi:alkylation response protein AidB-like acyl-CoA dehydrogenase
MEVSMDFKFSAEDEAFRSEFRSWLSANLPKAGKAEDGMDFMRESSADDWKRRLEWHKKMHAGGWVGISWPKEYGGRGATLTQQIIYNEELSKVNSPALVNGLGIMLVGPTIIHWGTEEQKKRYVPKILSADELWCQGYSEPGAGSDLAGLQTRAVLDGDTFIINGQKVWTSLAHRSDWQVLLVRTDPSAPKHKGISYLLVDMHSPGITVRPLVQITGDAGFNEVFYDNVRVPKENLVGEINQGWQVSIATLMWERVSGGTRHPVERTINELIELAKAIEFEGMPAYRHPYIRQKLSQFAIESRCLRLSRYRGLTAQLKGKVPGPESSFGKLFATELNLRVAMFADELLGPYGTLMKESIGAVEGGRWTMRTLAARGLTIAAGSSEIQHNIIGERVLKLPKG